MDNAKHFVALTQIVYQNANGNQVINLLELHIAFFHLAIDGIKVFASPGNLAMNPLESQLFRDN